jgi:hypothetical protein
MFTWICPQCGREVPPAYTECPNCTKKAPPVAAPPPSSVALKEPVTAGVAEAAPRSEEKPLAPPVEPAPAPAVQAPAPEPSVPRKRGLPVWLATILSAMVILGIVVGVYWVVNYFQNGHPGRPTTAEESPGAKPGAPVSAIQKFIEVSSVRFMEDPKRKEMAVVKFVVTNHSEADLTGLAGNVTIWASTGRSEEDAQGTFEFSTNLKGLESKELTAPLVGKKKIYELPDWQNMTTDVQITAPTS